MEKREKIIRTWFKMWLEKQDSGILELFSEDAQYIESWGPEYRGAHKIKLWFDEWHTRGDVLQWDIKQFYHTATQTAVEWYFKCQMYDGTVDEFEGMSLIRWSLDGKICFLQEFGCNIDRYDPYQNGKTPQFRQEAPKWF